MDIATVANVDYVKLLAIWEASVRATHDFLAEADLQALKPLLLGHYFDAVTLTCVKDSAGEILGFCGVQDGQIEMLFISPDRRGQGIGTRLVTYALQEQQAIKVDVNEQNEQALGFYHAMGFRVTGRSELDGEGNAYPLLHMALVSHLT